jgi:hypothetical protein
VFVSPEHLQVKQQQHDHRKGYLSKEDIFQEISKTLRNFNIQIEEEKKDEEVIDSLIEFLRTFEICYHSGKKEDKFHLFPLLMEDNIPMNGVDNSIKVPFLSTLFFLNCLTFSTCSVHCLE